MEFGKITLLVGGNNSGKSTISKAALLIKNFLSSEVSTLRNGNSFFPKFSFDVREPYDVHIGTFHNALNIDSGESGIRFYTQIEEFAFEFLVKGNREDINQTFGFVSAIEITDNNQGITINLNYETRMMNIAFDAEKTEDIVSKTSVLITKIEELKSKIDSSTDFSETVNLKEELAKSQQELASANNIEEKQPNFVLPCPSFDKLGYGFYIPAVFRVLRNYAAHGIIIDNSDDLDSKTNSMTKTGQEGLSLNDNYIEFSKAAALKFFQKNFKRIDQSSSRIELVVRKSLEEIPANSIKQQIFYNSLEKDVMAQYIHDYMSCRLEEDNREHSAREFVKKWMGKDKFGIGKDFEIITHQAEAYELNIVEANGKKMPLANKGTGSIHLMMLLLRLAYFIYKYQGRSSHPIIFIEEPEQNLHPKLQSLLTEMFSYIVLDLKYDFKFVIETHSEYLVRKSQVLVAEGLEKKTFDMENNPYKVYYLYSPENDEIFMQMEYKESGDFINSFGPGFYDEAADLDMKIFQREQSQKRRR